MSKLPADDPSLPQNAEIHTFSPSPMDETAESLSQYDGEEPDLIDAVIEYRKNHPEQQLTAEKVSGMICQAADTLQSLCDEAAQRFGLHIEIKVDANPNIAHRHATITILSEP